MEMRVHGVRVDRVSIGRVGCVCDVCAFVSPFGARHVDDDERIY